MQNSFAHWQPLYAEAGIALLPAIEKRPVVKNAGNFTPKASSKLIARHGNSERMGFWCGRGSSITVIDIDSTEPELLEMVLSRFGVSPIIARSPSGGHHVWYRHRGEKRQTRFEGLPLDVLGNGFVVAPPSRTERGVYTFLEGDLSAVNDLPVIAEKAWRNSSAGDTLRPRRAGAALLVPPAASLERVAEGNRNVALLSFCLSEAPTCRDLSELGARAAAYNRSTLLPPLSDAEVSKTVASAWRYQSEGRNWVGKGQFAPIPHSAIDGLLHDSPDALLLLIRLVREHYGLRNTFFVANAMAATMSDRPWSVKRLARARNALLATGRLIRDGWRGRVPTYRFGPATPHTPATPSVISIGGHSDHPTPF
ncbi:bifunctional DNA primase/polymerase [Novosphingobium bradum]|uniref:Bifunctional DNA primase/polymerase n=1 Tax=Novosphingobium bradum TaxID=1737444 RepID=A0ABV7IQS4_9SPHN